MEKLLKELGDNFRISGKELLILEKLSLKPMSAHEIVKKTSIPIGRIYDSLNHLISLKLIERTEKKPYKYKIDDLDTNINEFLQLQFENEVQKQHRMLHLMEHRKKNVQQIQTIESGDDFTFRTLQLLRESKYIKNIVRHGSVPFPLYPQNRRDFGKVRKAIVENRDTLAHTTPEMTLMIYKAHEDCYTSKKNMEYILEKQAFDFHMSLIKEKFGEKFYKNMITEILERINKYNLNIYIINEFIPMQIFLTDKKVFLALIHFMHTQGVIMSSEAAVSLYLNYFDEMKERSKPIIKTLKESIG